MITSVLPTGDRLNPLTNTGILTRQWSASWSRHPDDDLRGRNGVFLFRKQITLTAPPAQPFVLHVSADQRYRLYVNSVSVAWGPARGDLLHWRFETIDIGPLLREGVNILAAVVHHFAHENAPLAQISAGEAAFVVQGNGDTESASVDTPSGWKVWHDTAYSFSVAEAGQLHAYCVVGPSEQMDASRHPWGWMQPDFDDAEWLEPVATGRKAAPYGTRDSETPRWLVPRSIPSMEETPQPFGSVVRADGVEIPDGWPTDGKPLTIAANTRAVLLLDHGFETCAFPEITVSGGAGASLRLAYAEALFVPGGAHWEKGNRNEIDGKTFRGYSDSWRLDGGTDRLLRPLWWKTFRYAELTVETGDNPLAIASLVSVYTGYPFAELAQFDAPELSDAKAIWQTGWRTARLCAHESYMDCPYYEQLQYVGDTRIQCLISLYMSGDSRLFRNALTQIDNSRLSDGLTQSRYPARFVQMIPPFSLWYIGMVDDYRRHVPGDDAFLYSLLPGIRGILEWFRARLRPDGLLGPLEFWNFVDWCHEWGDSAPPGHDTGGSSVLTLQYAIACDEMANLLNRLDGAHLDRRLVAIEAEEARYWEDEAKVARNAARALCYDPVARRIADTPEKLTCSQHASILAVLADAVPAKDFASIMERVLADTNAAQARFYFRFYLNRALVKAGLGDRWLETLDPWREMLALGLTTWAETPEPTRSDCHAWSAAPNYEFLATVLGIQPGGNGGNDRFAYPGVFPAGSGWQHIRIAPNLGTLTEAEGVVPHPAGEIRVAFRRNDDILDAEITLPDVDAPDGRFLGRLFWKGKTLPLYRGHQSVTIKAE